MTIIAALTAAVAALLSVLYVARQLGVASKAHQFAVLQEMHKIMRARMPKDDTGAENAYYALRHRFEVPLVGRATSWHERDYRGGMINRILVVRQLALENERLYEEEVALVRHVVNAHNDVADFLDNRLLDIEAMLRTYHVTLMREIFIAEPYLWHEAAVRGHGRWGFRALRLGEIARQYHRMNPIHRGPVGFTATGDDRAIMPEVVAGRLTRLWWWMRRHTLAYPRITDRSKRRQVDLMGDLRRRVAAQPPERQDYARHH